MRPSTLSLLCLALTGPGSACPAHPCSALLCSTLPFPDRAWPSLPCSALLCSKLPFPDLSRGMVPLHVTTGGAELSDMASKGRYHEDVFGVMISAKVAQQTRVNLASKKAELLELAHLVRSCDIAGTTLSLSRGVCSAHAAAVLHAGMPAQACTATYALYQCSSCCYCASAPPSGWCFGVVS